MSINSGKSDQHGDGLLPIYLLTGFLGSGKSTLLKSMLASADFHRTLVIVNEFGEVGVDHLLLNRDDGDDAVANDIVLLESGCLCCSVQGELRDTLKRLARINGEAVPFDKIIIETTGLADPGPILASIASDAFLSHHYSIGGVLTVVDPVAETIPLAVQREWRRQIASADTLYVSKTDLATTEKTSALVQMLEEMNSAADVVLARIVNGQHALAALMESLLRTSHAKNRKFMLTPQRAPRFPMLQKTGISHLEQVQTICLPLPEDIDWLKFSLWFSLLLHAHGDCLLRSKGIIRVAAYDRPLIIHSVGRYLYPPEHHEGEACESRLVMIVCGLEVERIRQSFAVMVKH